MIQISFVIPAKNEEDSVKLLYQKLVTELKKLKKSYEVIFIDDGSTDQTLTKLKSLKSSDPKVKIIKFRGNFGKSAALQAGFNLAQGEVVFTLDADLQDDPAEIENFLKKLDQGYDLVSGWKKSRHDPLHTVIFSRVLNNLLIPLLTGVHIHDTNCGFKAYRKDVIKTISLYGELYRYIPIIAAKQKFKVAEIPITHHKRRFGKSKFGIGKNIKGLLDLLTITFLTGYIQRPGHFFGTLGITSFSLGFAIGIYITYLRLTTGSIQFRHPLLFLGMLLMIIGVQLVTTGLVAELIVNYNSNKSNNHIIQEVI